MRRKSLTHYWQIAALTIVVNMLLFLTMMWDNYSSERITQSADKRILLSVSGTGESGPGVAAITEVAKANPSAAFLPKSVKDIDENPQRDLKNPPVQLEENLVNPIEEESSSIVYDEKTGVYDKFRMFRTHAFSRTGSKWKELSQRNICLGVQTSIDRLYQIVELTEGWTGQVSLSIFTPDVELAIAKTYIPYLTRCFPQIAQQVSFHLVEPTDHPGRLHTQILQEIQHDQVSCSDYESYMKKLLSYRPKEMMEWREKYAYPQNLLRNVAKNSCQTNFTYIPDIDMVLPRDMNAQLETLFSSEKVQNCKKCAFVVPTYEISDKVEKTPQTKAELLKMKKEGLARGFHTKLFNINQQSSNLSAWEALPLDQPLDVAYQVKKYIFKYEPLYIARADTPQFDERFIGFGMTRNTQVYEMYVAGYQFHLLNNAFTNHRGFQNLSKRPQWRAKQQELNNHKFDEFAKELTAHYGRDPYNMIEKLPKMNLKNIRVIYNKNAKS